MYQSSTFFQVKKEMWICACWVKEIGWIVNKFKETAVYLLTQSQGSSCNLKSEPYTNSI